MNAKEEVQKWKELWESQLESKPVIDVVRDLEKDLRRRKIINYELPFQPGDKVAGGINLQWLSSGAEGDVHLIAKEKLTEKSSDISKVAELIMPFAVCQNNMQQDREKLKEFNRNPRHNETNILYLKAADEIFNKALRKTQPAHNDAELEKLTSQAGIARPSSFELLVLKWFRPVGEQKLAAVRTIAEAEQEKLYDVSHGRVPRPVGNLIEGKGAYGFLMKYLDAKPLSRVVNDPYFANEGEKIVPQPVTLAIMAQMTETLADLIDQDILQLDVQQNNFLIDMRTGKLYAIDLGLAERITEGKKTISGQVGGDPRYMSPEIIKELEMFDKNLRIIPGHEVPLEQKSPVNSIGNMFYRLATSKFAFGNDINDFDGIKSRKEIGSYVDAATELANKQGLKKHYTRREFELLRSMLQKQLEPRPTMREAAYEFRDLFEQRVGLHANPAAYLAEHRMLPGLKQRALAYDNPNAKMVKEEDTFMDDDVD